MERDHAAPVTVGDVYCAIDGFAPFELAEEWDNSGLLAGSRTRQVRKILCALDLNSGVLDEAVEAGADLIVTHHPIMFRGRKNLCEDDAEGKLLCGLIRANIALIAAHTNFDNADPGVNNVLAEKLGLKDVTAVEEGMRIGTCEPTPLAEFAKLVEKKLSGPVRVYGQPDKLVSRIAMLGGAGGGYAPLALQAGADAYITGEIAHHNAWNAYESGMAVLECGHAATEQPAIGMMCRKLREAFEDIEVVESSALLFK